MSADNGNVVVVLAAFRGEHLVLQQGRGGTHSGSFSFPTKYVGFPTSSLLYERDVDDYGLKAVIRTLGRDADVLKPKFVARIPVKTQLGDYQIQLVYTCVMSGYFDGVGVKPDAIPENFFPGHGSALDLVRWFWEREQKRT